MTMLLEVVTWFTLNLSTVKEVPAWIFWLALPFTLLGIGAAGLLCNFVWGCIKGMERGL